MSVVKFQKLDRFFSSGEDLGKNLWLVHGEEFLRNQASNKIISALLPDTTDPINYEPVDYSINQVSLALEKINTYSFLPGPKVVALLESRVFDSPKAKSNLITKAENAFADDDIKSAAQHFLRLLATLNLSLEDITIKDSGQVLKLDAAAKVDWLKPVIDYCRKNGLTVPSSKAPAKALEEAIGRGFPTNHYLIISTDLIDRRRRLYKLIEAKGVVVDCAVPYGSRQADRSVQTAVLKERMTSILTQHGKQLGGAAFQALVEKTGFQVRVFCGNLEKLIAYVGERKRITETDVITVLSRTKEDPVFELTGAVSERDLDKALFYLKTILAQDLHPLQIVAALSNQNRKLMMARQFIADDGGRVWNAQMEYGQFQRVVMPAIETYDSELHQMMVAWNTAIETASSNREKQPSSKGKTKRVPPKSDTRLLLAPGRGSPYALYLLMQNAYRYTLNELIDIHLSLFEADQRMKGGEKDAVILLNQLIVRICH